MTAHPSAPPPVDLGPRCRAVLLIAAAADDDWMRLADALHTALPAGWHVAVASQDGPSTIADAVRAVAARGTDDLVVLPLEPAYSAMYTGTILQDLYEALRHGGEHLSVAVRTTWYDDAGYVNALARYLAEPQAPLAHHLGDADLQFVAPTLLGADGRSDTRYEQQIRCTAELTVARLGWPADRWSLTFGTTPAVAPEPHAVCCRLPLPTEPGTAGEPLVHCRPPLWFTDPFVSALRNIVLHGSQRATAADRASAPLLLVPCGSASRDESAAELVMIGAAVANGLGCGRGAAQRASEPEALALAKTRTRKALRAFLDWTREETPLRDTFVWNTCQRIELYGWLPTDLDAAERACVIARTRSTLFGAEPPAGLRINVLAGREARHHLLRTACGLNSALPGDRDVVAQLQTACRIAQCARTAGVRTTTIVNDAATLARAVNAETTWGRFSTGYCAAALARICEVDGARPDRFHHVVIGGSTTSRSILSTLAEEHGVPRRQMTLVYRDHHGQMRQLRAALGSGRRIRVHTYGETSVLHAIADADFVFFGIDQAEPVLDAAALLGLRDYRARPLTLVDFNSSGSIAGSEQLGPISLWSAKELDQAVAAHAAVTSSRSGFAAAVAEAEARILHSLPPERAPCNPVPASNDAGQWSPLR